MNVRLLRLWFVGWLAVVFLVAGNAHANDGTVPVPELKRRFYQSLDRGEILKVLKTLDRQRKLSDTEKGARYRWERIPVDRRPPRELGNWWRGLTLPEKNAHRLRWFHNNAVELKVDRVALILSRREELLNLEQTMLNAQEKQTVKLNPIPMLDEQRSDTAGGGRIGSAPVGFTWKDAHADTDSR